MSLAEALSVFSPPTGSLAFAAGLLRTGSSLWALEERAAQFDSIDVLAEPITLFTQNMGLFPVAVVQVEIQGVTIGVAPLYKGTERSKALPSMASWLRTHRPDVVVLTEVWVDDEAQSFASEMSDVYPHHTRGPNETSPRQLLPGVDLEFEKFGGGVLILSKHEVLASNQSIYRQCKGEDCFSNKGVLHVRVAAPGITEGIDVFGTHMQSCPPEITAIDIDVGPGNCDDKLRFHQTEHLSAFIQANSSPNRPAFLLGDLNQNGRVPEQRDNLFNRLHLPIDLWDIGGDPDLPATSDKLGSFTGGLRDENDPQRRRNGARIDYVLSWPGARIPGTIEVLSGEVRSEIIQSSPGRDVSDHYGLSAKIRGIGRRKIQDAALSAVKIHVNGLRSLRETGGPVPLLSEAVEHDEIGAQFTFVRGSDGHRTPVYKEVHGLDTGGWKAFTQQLCVEWPDPGPFVQIECAIKELDEVANTGVYTGTTSLGSRVLRVSRREMLRCRGRGRIKRMLPIFRGDGGEYAVEVSIEVE